MLCMVSSGTLLKHIAGGTLRSKFWKMYWLIHYNQISERWLLWCIWLDLCVLHFVGCPKLHKQYGRHTELCTIRGHMANSCNCFFSAIWQSLKSEMKYSMDIRNKKAPSAETCYCTVFSPSSCHFSVSSCFSLFPSSSSTGLSTVSGRGTSAIDGNPENFGKRRNLFFNIQLGYIYHRLEDSLSPTLRQPNRASGAPWSAKLTDMMPSIFIFQTYVSIVCFHSAITVVLPALLFCAMHCGDWLLVRARWLFDLFCCVQTDCISKKLKTTCCTTITDALTYQLPNPATMLAKPNLFPTVVTLFAPRKQNQGRIGRIKDSKCVVYAAKQKPSQKGEKNPKRWNEKRSEN